MSDMTQDFEIAMEQLRSMRTVPLDEGEKNASRKEEEEHARKLAKRFFREVKIPSMMLGFSDTGTVAGNLVALKGSGFDVSSAKLHEMTYDDSYDEIVKRVVFDEFLQKVFAPENASEEEFVKKTIILAARVIEEFRDEQIREEVVGHDQFEREMEER